MANELVPVRKQVQAAETEEEWNLPPVILPHTEGQFHRDEGAQNRAEKDISHAKRRGDNTFVSVRETDLAEHRQHIWDWGDFRTWAIIVGMCIGFLAVCLLVYVLPANRAPGEPGGHATTPGIRVY